MTNVTMSKDFLARLAREIDLIVAVKIEALPPAPKVGTVSARTGNLPATRSLFNRYLPLLSLSARTTDTFLFTQKEILRRRGILPAATMRHPSERVDAHYLRELDALLNDLGLASLGRNWNPIGDR
ncbi:MAG TPA: hypothetical protein VKB09_05955, partial [Thermomicrobiales bacterium]|nr:hypothetical protein [Thermomicrobiales bacterium]